MHLPAFPSISFCSVQRWLEVDQRTWHSDNCRLLVCCQGVSFLLSVEPCYCCSSDWLCGGVSPWSVEEWGGRQKDLGRWLGLNLLLWQKKENCLQGIKMPSFSPPPPSPPQQSGEGSGSLLASELCRLGTACVSTVWDWQHKLKLNTDWPKSPMLPWFVENRSRTWMKTCICSVVGTCT